ncbi:hypothetical protein BC830DRAFT_1082392 [Chytriomyces sp. MP71]|nr:hypothetical protein BC830DRAFT_1082392 [Chytriomyces sp. MP71]
MSTTASLPAGTTPRMLLQQAQNAIAQGDLRSAVSHFSVLVSFGEQLGNDAEFNPALALLSRASCYMQLNDYASALADATKALKMRNVKTSVELYTGCYSTRSAAASFAADATRALGDREGFMAYKRMATEFMKSEAGKAEVAEKVKDEGNVLFKEGNLDAALERYNKALELDSTNTAALSNASLCLLKLGKLGDALKMAERCTGLNPDWSKGWYRKGCVLNMQGKYTEAAASFQTGIESAPDDTEMKKAYMEAIEKANIAPSSSASSSKGKDNSKWGSKATASKADVNHAKKMMGMMMDLQYNSFDIKTFFERSPTHTDFSTWSIDITPHLSKRNTIDLIDRVMQLHHAAFKSGSPPASTSTATRTDHTWESYILPDHPLLTGVLLLHLLTENAPAAGVETGLLHKGWTLAFTHQADEGKLLGEPLQEYVARTRTYAILLSRDVKTPRVLDFLGLWNKATGGRKDAFMQELLRVGAGAREGKSVVVYTCGEWQKGLEYVEGYYAGLHADRGQGVGKVEDVSMKVDDEKEVGKKEERDGRKNMSFGDEGVLFEGEEIVSSRSIDDEIDTGDFKGQVKTTEHIFKPKSEKRRYCFGILERQTAIDVGVGAALFVVGIAVCVAYL